MTGLKLRARPALPRDWRDSARCRGMDAEIFWPTTAEDERYAIGICLGCDVMEECLADAIATGERHAVRGGRRFGPATRDTE